MYAAAVMCALASLMVADAPKEKPFKPTAVFRGTHSQIKKERFVQVLSADAWKKLWQEHRGKENRFTESDQELDVDFDWDYVIGISTGNADWCSLVPRIRDKEVVIGYRGESHQTEGGPLGHSKPPTPEELEREKKELAQAPYAFIILPRTIQSVAIEQNVQRMLGEPPLWKHRTRFVLPEK